MGIHEIFHCPRSLFLLYVGKLKVIRDKIIAEGGDGTALQKERDAALAENERMKKEIEKLNYRVSHLIKELNAAEKAK